jgi:glycerophosphoryl diester phosphodiesterase
MLIISHRGYHVTLPENTLAAFAAAAEMGVDGIETDLRVSADGQLILFHDRLAPDGREVAEVTAAELSRQTGYEVPTAESVLKRWPELLWNLEIKVPAALGQCIELIERYRATHRLFVTSFWHNLVDEVSLRTGVDCGLLVAHCPRAPIVAESLPVDLPAEQQELYFARMRVKSTVWYYETMDVDQLPLSRRAGRRNYAYGVYTPADHRRCAELGLDGIITDRPEFAR